MCFMSPEQMQQVGMQASSVLPILLGRLMQGAPGAQPPGQAPGMGMIPPGSAMGAMTTPMGPPGAGPPPGPPTSFPLPSAPGPVGPPPPAAAPPPPPVPLRSAPRHAPVVEHKR